MRFELNQNSEIVKYEGETQFITKTSDKIIELFSQGTHTARITHQDGSVYTLEITNNVTKNTRSILLFYGNIRNENRNPSEKKIQLNGKDPRESEITPIILGIYCYQSNDVLEDLICSAWYVDDTVNYPSNPSIRGINIQMFQEARFNGFIKKNYRNNTVCVFRPEFVFYYLESINEHHSSSTNSAISKEIQCLSINKIFYGAPGTGKSYKLEQILKSVPQEQKERITFHPDFDYASFVGGYKPVSVKKEDESYDIQYKFVPQAFANIYVRAWKDANPENKYYLAIEEINRGNCAEIFGDIFQLLDRDANYTVTPSDEFQNFLEEELGADHDGLKDGLKLPKNLYIYATMNTSDQSLFPMDSAFKRRWDWEYIPICYDETTEEGNPNPSFSYSVQLDENRSFSWNDFISKINTEHIQNEPTLGMDKCIGNYFIKPNADNVITLEAFINKVLFYLWNDVFKDEKNEVFAENEAYESYFPIKSNGLNKLIALLKRIDIEIKENPQNDQEEQQDEVIN